MSKQRNRFYKLLQVGKRELGWDEEVYRTVLASHGATEKNGHISATTMTELQLQAVLHYMRKSGFIPRATRFQSGAKTSSYKQARIKKAYAIWHALADAGVINNPSMRALHRYAENITGKAVIDWATGPELNQILEGLKCWAIREKVSLR